jgi:hypothetical protein
MDNENKKKRGPRNTITLEGEDLVRVLEIRHVLESEQKKALPLSKVVRTCVDAFFEQKFKPAK